VGYKSHVLAPWSVPGKSGQIRGLVALLKQATSDAHTRKSGVSSSFCSVPGPVRRICHISVCVWRPWTARNHQRSACRCHSSGGHTPPSLLMLAVVAWRRARCWLAAGYVVVGARLAGGGLVATRRG